MAVPRARAKRLSAWEVLGGVLLVALVCWLAAITVVRQGRLTPDLVAYYLVPALALAVGFGLARWRLPHTTRDLVIVAAAFAALIMIMTTLLDARAGGQPTGYANANAAVAVQLAAILGILADGTRGLRRLGLALLALATLALTLVNQSVFGALSGIGVGVLLVVPWLARRLGRLIVPLGAIAVAAAAAALVSVASSQPWADHLAAVADPVRRDLWHIAFRVWARQPLTGSGAGSFAAANPHAIDRDTAMAHSSLLQAAAEGGVIAAAGLAAIAIVGFVIILRSRGAAAALAAAAWTAVCGHALVDHITDYPLVLFSAGITLALAYSYAHTPSTSVRQPAV